MQQLASNGNDNSNSNITNSMPPQVQHQPQVQMQSIHPPPYQPLQQLNGLQEWQNQQQSSNQPQGQLQLPSNSTPSSPIPKPLSSTNLSVISSGTGNSRNSKTKSPRHEHQIRRGSGVDIKGPTPEVAQQLRFPWKLHLLLERCEYEHQQKLAACAAEGTSPNSVPDMPISWLPCGKAFKVHDKERFVREVMPSFFGTQSFKTFQRNLNLWGFTRVSKGPQKDVCSHPLFLKGFPAVCQSMKRIVLKGTGRGNRAPLGGVDVSSVQAVVAAAAMQQAQQQQAQQKANGMNQGGSNFAHNIQAQQVLQHQQQLQAHQKAADMNGMPQQSTFTHIHPNQQQNLQQQVPQMQQQQFLIENGSILPAPIPSQQKLVVLPSQPNPNASATTTVLWPNIINQPLQQQQMQQPLNAADAGANLQKSLQQLSAIIQQLNGCNGMTTSTANTNTVNNNSNSNNNNTVNTTNFQQQQQFQAPAPIPGMIQQQQPSNPNAVVAPSPMSTQDLVALLLQRNLQQQVSQVQCTQPQQPQSQVQLQVPTSLFPSGNFSGPAPATQQQSNGTGNNHFATATSPVNFQQPQQQQIIGNNSNLFQQQPQAQQMAVATPTPAPSANGQQQQNQLLQLLLQQSGWSTSSSA